MILNPQDIHRIGKSLKAHGKEGYLRLDIDDSFLEDLLKARALFVDLEGSSVPFLIQDIKELNHLLVKLDEVNSPEEAAPLQLKTISLHEEDLSKVPKVKAAEVDALVGFQLHDHNKTFRGNIIEIQEFPHQVIATVEKETQSFLLPIHENMIIDVDEESKVLIVEWPEGIEDI